MSLILITKWVQEKKDTKAEIENMKYVLDNRIKILDESLKDINELLAEGEALLGKDFRAICNKSEVTKVLLTESLALKVHSFN